VFDAPAPDHPHARGDHAGGLPTEATNAGPSPRAWGSPFVIGNVERISRTIPTRVGITHGSQARQKLTPDHPHARGDHRASSVEQVGVCGPSPRAWGSRLQTFQRESLPEDHPHARGDHIHGTASITANIGPSPRAWGSLRLTDQNANRYRTIPTRVGITHAPSTRRAPGADHPHARGDHRPKF